MHKFAIRVLYARVALIFNSKMRDRKKTPASLPSQPKMSQKQRKSSSAKEPLPKRALRRQQPTNKRGKLTPSQERAKVLDLAAVNLVRKGLAKTVSEAARTVGTTVRSIRKLLPAALGKRGLDGRIRVKAGDTYSARVEIVTPSGPLKVTAHGSRERDLAGLYSSTLRQVLNRKAPPSSLRQFRGKKIGGHKLISDFNQLRTLVLAGVLGQLDTLYASPEVSS